MKFSGERVKFSGEQVKPSGEQVKFSGEQVIFPDEQLICKARRCVYFSATVQNSIGSAGEFTSPAPEDLTVPDLPICETTSREASETMAEAQTEPLDTENFTCSDLLAKTVGLRTSREPLKLINVYFLVCKVAPLLAVL